MSIRERCEDRKRAPLLDRIMLWLSTDSRTIDGLWIGSYFQENAEPALRRVEEALRLIKTYDRPKYDRLSRDLDRIWVRLLTAGGVAQFNPPLRACLPPRRAFRVGRDYGCGDCRGSNRARGDPCQTLAPRHPLR